MKSEVESTIPASAARVRATSNGSASTGRESLPEHTMKVVIYAAIVANQVRVASNRKHEAEAYCEVWNRLNRDRPAEVKEQVVEFK